MSALVVGCGIIIMFIICISLVIFAPKKNVFHNINDCYPNLLNNFNTNKIELIHKEVAPDDWKDIDSDKILKGSYMTINLYEDNEYRCDIKKYPQTVNILSQINNLKKAYLARIGPKTILKVKKNNKNFMNISIPLEKGFDTANQCGVWVKRETRCLYRNILYDTSNIHSIYNKTTIPIKVIILEMEWPNCLPNKIHKDIPDHEQNT